MRQDDGPLMPAQTLCNLLDRHGKQITDCLSRSVALHSTVANRISPTLEGLLGVHEHIGQAAKNQVCL